MEKLLPLTLIRAGGLPFEMLAALGRDWSANLENWQNAQQNLRDKTDVLHRTLSHLLEILPENAARTAVYNARKNLFQQKKADWARLLAFQDGSAAWADVQMAARGLAEAEQSRADALQSFESQWNETLLDNYAHLQNAAAHPVLQRGLLFASHELLRRLPDFRAAQPGNFDKKTRGTALAVYQYLARAAAKTSPFAHFSTVHLTRLGDANEDDAPPFEKVAVVPNVAVLEALYEMLLAYPVFYQSLSVRLNPFIVKQLPVYEFLYFDGENESFQQLTADAVVDFVVETLLENERQMPFAALQNRLAETVEAPPERLERFLLDLADIGFLDWDWPEKGWSAGWPGGLMNFLGHLPAEPVVVETAALLQWLRGAARALAFQEVPAASQTQAEATEKLRAHFAEFGGKMPPLSPEQVFYADVAAPAKSDFGTETEFPDLLRTFPKAVSDWLPPRPAPPINQLTEQPTDLPTFFKNWQAQKIENQLVETNFSPNPFDETRHLGLLFQPFRGTDGQLCAVLNAWFPGGGRMFGRWLPLFSETAERELRDWCTEMTKSENGIAHFAALGWHNANFHPLLHEKSLDWPGGRSRKSPQNLLAGTLSVAEINGRARLIEPETGRPLQLVDPGLESWQSRTAAARMLLNLGVPKVSLRRTLAQMSTWQTAGPGLKTRSRIQHGSWVFARAAWQMEPMVWQNWLGKLGTGKFSFFLTINALREAWQLPRQVFYRFPASGGKPQYLDFGSPVSVLLFEKMLRSAGEATLEIVEMLPAPGQLLTGYCLERVGEMSWGG
ncbi:MAG: lantibiotic dehydratase [Saprospiraceae bacterium]